jgi:hypothetical protein
MKPLISVICVSVFLISFCAEAQGMADADLQIKGVIQDEKPADNNSGKGFLGNTAIQKGKIHFAASVGYALPVIDLDTTDGSLPIRIAADYFLIDGLALGLRFVFSPCFVEGSNTMFIFNLQPEVLYMFKFGLDVYFALGLMTVSSRVEDPMGGDSTAQTTAAAGMALGISYNLFFTRHFALEIGAEFDFNWKPDQDVLYPLFFLGGRFSMGPT